MTNSKIIWKKGMRKNEIERFDDVLVMALKNNMLYPIFCRAGFELERVKKSDALKYSKDLLKKGYEIVFVGVDLSCSTDTLSKKLFKDITKAPLLASSYLIYEKGMDEEDAFSKLFTPCGDVYILEIGISDPSNGCLEIFDERSDEASDFANRYGGYDIVNNLKVVKRDTKKKLK